MNGRYRQTGTTTSLLQYHFVFCPRYRRKIFQIDGLEAQFRTLVYQICEQNKMEVLSLECCTDHVRLSISALPSLRPENIMKIIRRNTTSAILKAYPDILHGPTLWTRNYFVTTEKRVSEATIMQYVNAQKMRL